MAVEAKGLTIKSVGNLLEAGVHFALQALFHIEDQVLKAVHLAVQMVHLAFQVIHFAFQVIRLGGQVIHFAFQVVRLSGQVIHFTFQLVRLSSQVIHLAGELIYLADHVIHSDGELIYLTGKLLYRTDDLLKFAHFRYTDIIRGSIHGNRWHNHAGRRAVHRTYAKGDRQRVAIYVEAGNL
jgi:hypothetical protein